MQNINVEVTDKDGWHKEYVLRKTINHVGADTRSDIVLENSHGTGVSARHLQIILGNAGCHVVNIGAGDISIASGVYDTTPGAIPAQVRPLSPLSTTDVQNGTWIKVGDFTLRVQITEPATAQSVSPGYTQTAIPTTPAMASASSGAVPVAAAVGTAASAAFGGGQASMAGAFNAPPMAAPASAASPNALSGDSIGLRLQLPQTILTLDAPLEGTVVVRNAGNRPGAQFRLEIQGLPAECCEIGPGPILFPNAEREVPFHLTHTHQATPPAGDTQLLIRATAPDAYPGQVAMVTQTIQVAPFYQHSLILRATD